MQRWTASALEGARIGLVGLGLEGRANLAWVLRSVPGAQPLLFDERSAEIEGPWERHVGALEGLPLERCDVLLRSPGVPTRHPALVAARARGIPVTSGSSLFLAAADRPPVVAVTGTKGKSTVSALSAALLSAAGLPAAVGGNIGVPLVALDRAGVAVVIAELSSYQCADLAGEPEFAVLTNLFPEHLDWHGGLEAYYRDKLRLLGLARRLALVNGRNDEGRRRSRPFSQRRLFGAADGWQVDPGAIRRAGRRVRAGPAWSLRGRHNLDNLEAALAVVEACCELLGADPNRALEAIDGFEGLPHRQEIVAARDGVRFVNDSISTTPYATLAALDAFGDGPVAVIVGGFDRGLDWHPFARRLAQRPVAAVIVRGANGAGIREALAAVAPGQRVRSAGSLEEAVASARELLPAAGGTVLLSPGAPSFGEFRDFRERGECFRQCCAPGERSGI